MPGTLGAPCLSRGVSCRRETLLGLTEGMSMTESIAIRPAGVADLGAINAIYNYYVAHSTCVWTMQPCSEAERKAWYQEHGCRRVGKLHLCAS